MKLRPLLVAFGLGIAAAGFAVTAAADADVENGRVLAYTCHGCHGVPNYRNAFPNYSVPKLGGQSAQYIVNALKAYASGERTHQTMHSHAATLSDQDRADIAAYLESERVEPSTQVVGTAPPATQTCVACHGPAGARTVAPDYPILAGQYADYIVQSLRDYKSGKRKNPIMAGIIGGIEEKDFAAIAQFFSQQPGLCDTQDLRKHGRCVTGE